MRDAVSLLDQMFSFGDKTVTLRQVQQTLGAVGGQMVNELVDALAEREIPNGLRLVSCRWRKTRNCSTNCRVKRYAKCKPRRSA
jgi:DNA polymerase III gamma/tau subunit